MFLVPVLDNEVELCLVSALDTADFPCGLDELPPSFLDLLVQFWLKLLDEFLLVAIFPILLTIIFPSPYIFFSFFIHKENTILLCSRLRITTIIILFYFFVLKKIL